MKLMFLDGPARGVTLHADRAPAYLRLGQSLTGEWRALAGLTDTPRDAEVLFAYKKCSGGDWIASYRLNVEQPDRLVLISTNGWREWCEEQVRPY